MITHKQGIVEVAVRNTSGRLKLSNLLETKTYLNYLPFLGRKITRDGSITKYYNPL